jgi:dihydroneopterin aldolase/2-amino-4-hydroxy-6-hydroxymethyldihydropteridine diphosphokinase
MEVNMDQLIIKDLELFAYHGVNQEEKNMGQKFILEAIIDLDLSSAGENDQIDSALNYAKLCHELQHIFTAYKHDLIERAATVLCDYILTHYAQVKKVDVTLKKPWAPIHLPLDYPAVRLVRAWHKAYIALGSNMGDKKQNIKQALDYISKAPHTQLVRSSSLIVTAPVGYTDQDDFLNGVCEIKTTLSPTKLMDFLLNIENTLGRIRTLHWGPRTIDLDVLYYDDCITDDPHITLPHPRMTERKFVLEPLNEIAPYAIHPLLKKRTFELIKDTDMV